MRHKLAAEGIDELVATCYDEGAIRLYDEEYFREHVEGWVDERDPNEPEVEDYIHSVLAGAESVSVDKQGRVRIPPRLREDAGIERHCVVISLLHRIEVWEPEAWERRRSEARGARRRRRGT